MTRDEFAARLRGFIKRDPDNEAHVKEVTAQIEKLAETLPPGLMLLETGPSGLLKQVLKEALEDEIDNVLSRMKVPPELVN
jgi:hypothetical protein